MFEGENRDVNYWGSINRTWRAIPKEQEITQSLKEFACRIIMKTEKRPLSLEEIKNDFACNGYNVQDDACQINFKLMYQTFMKNYQYQRAEVIRGLKQPVRKFNRLVSTENVFPVGKTSFKNKQWSPTQIGSQFCVFCDNNHEPEALVRSHAVRDSLGKVLCPKLRIYICPICGETGDNAHTIKYCPKRPIITMEDTLVAENLRLARVPYYKNSTKI